MRRVLFEWEDLRFDRLLGVLSAIVLPLATIGTAWCGYQSARWSGLQERRFVEATSAYISSAKLTNQAQQIVSLHVNLFVEWLSATNQGDQTTADFLYNRFPVALKGAVDAWLAENPFSNPNSPSSPFDMPEYQLAEVHEAERLSTVADEMYKQASIANMNSDHHVLLTLVYASVLFFGGISGKFRLRIIDFAMICIAFVLWIAGSAILLTLPIY